jgi:catechol 2,3-dioxygenase-like lactoylglutathione lyase family enzyme
VESGSTVPDGVEGPHVPNPADLHHFAIVTDDLGKSMDVYSGALGLTWATPWSGTIPIIAGGEHHEASVSFTLSMQGPPHLELIRSDIPTVWSPGDGLHHFGVWVDDFDQSVRGLTSQGFTIEVMSPTSDFAYLRTPDGARVELVDVKSRPDFDRWIDGGRL